VLCSLEVIAQESKTEKETRVTRMTREMRMTIIKGKRETKRQKEVNKLQGEKKAQPRSFER